MNDDDVRPNSLMKLDHSTLPSISRTRLPANYETAKAALATCERIDEYKDWADKAAALASYAKQSNDTELEHMAMRVRVRALRRCGELLQQVEKAQGKRTDKPELWLFRGAKLAVGGGEGRRLVQEAEGHGLARCLDRLAHLRQAGRRRDPATVTELGKMGSKERARPKPIDPALDLGDIDPRDFKVATGALVAVGQVQDFATDHDSKSVVRGCRLHEKQKLLGRVNDGLE